MDGVPPSVCPSGFDRPRRPPALSDAPAPPSSREQSPPIALFKQLRAYVQRLLKERRPRADDQMKGTGQGAAARKDHPL